MVRQRNGRDEFTVPRDSNISAKQLRNDTNLTNHLRNRTKPDLKMLSENAYKAVDLTANAIDTLQLTSSSTASTASTSSGQVLLFNKFVTSVVYKHSEGLTSPLLNTNDKCCCPTDASPSPCRRPQDDGVQSREQ